MAGPTPSTPTDRSTASSLTTAPPRGRSRPPRPGALLPPGAVKPADLNGDGIPDLAVADGGGDNVLVYLGLGDGQFGPALNGGHGFFTGTDPVGVTAADVNGDGRPDLVVANRGSDDVSILLNVPQGDGFTFILGQRLRAGTGPAATVVGDVTGDGKPDILVSNSLSNSATLLPGVGGGFFNDQSPPDFQRRGEPGPDLRRQLRRPGSTW